MGNEKENDVIVIVIMTKVNDINSVYKYFNTSSSECYLTFSISASVCR